MFKSFWQLIKVDLLLLKNNIKNEAINMFVWGGSTCIITGYVLQAFGISKDFGEFQATSLIVSVLGFQLFSQIFMFLADVEGDKHVQYQMSLPLPNWLVFIKMAMVYIANGLILSFLMLPVMKIFLWQQIDLFKINIPLFLVTLLVVCSFFAFFCLFLVSFVKNMKKVENVFMRLLFPLWFFGGFQFSYKIAHQISPVFGYGCLLSPYTFATEAMRYTMLDPKDFMPIWVSLSVLIILTVICGYYGITRLRKRLDLI